MTETQSPSPAATTAAETHQLKRPYWRPLIEPYERPVLWRSLLDIATSVVPYVGLMVAAYITWGDISYWITLPMALLAGAFLLRTFIVFHDCAHGSFFASRRANTWVGRLCALLTFQAYADWRHKHAVHHGSAGDLDRRGTGDVHTLTLEEYQAKPWQGRLAYRLFRNPIVMFGIGPLWALMVTPRIVSPGMKPRARHSVLLTNVGVGLLIAFVVVFVGAMPWVLIQLPAAILAGMAGVLLFYVQHQFEDVYWEDADTWNYAEAALRGSSYLKLPQPLQFFTGNIGLHHVHHLSAKVPNYNLQRAHDEIDLFEDVPVLTIGAALSATRLKVIDTDTGGLLTWSEVRARRRGVPISAAGF
jgi:acyl-lipid omega-6 desaturase (Delta-12 desaturase)